MMSIQFESERQRSCPLIREPRGDDLPESFGEGSSSDRVSPYTRNKVLQEIKLLIDYREIHAWLMKPLPEGRGLSREDADGVIEGYQMFLYIKWRHMNEILVPPSPIAAAWRRHGENPAYEEDCTMILRACPVIVERFGVNDSMGRERMFFRIASLYAEEFPDDWRGWNTRILTDEEARWEKRRRLTVPA